MTKYRTWIDTFSAGLDELPRRKQRSVAEVLKVLYATGEYSIFEATANKDIARTMDEIVARKLITTDNSYGYPWTRCKLTAAGLELIGVKQCEAQNGA